MKIINSIQYNDAEFADLITHTELPWVYYFRLKQFLQSRKEGCLQFEDKTWIMDIIIIVEVTEKPVNQKSTYCPNAFKTKLKLWQSHLIKKKLAHFQNVDVITSFTQHLHMIFSIRNIHYIFLNQFIYMDKNVIAKIVSHFQISNEEDMELEVVNFKNYVFLKSLRNIETF